MSGRARLHQELENGTALIFSDVHCWGHRTPGMQAVIHLAGILQPDLLVANGDVFDGSQNSKHAAIGFEHKPTVGEELAACKEFLGAVISASPGSRRVWTRGNHDLRFETFLAAAAPMYEGVPGFQLREHFPEWEPCWRLDVNCDFPGYTIIKHRKHSGVHAARNNVVAYGCHVVTGHTHRLVCVPVTNAYGTHYGVECGFCAEPEGPQFTNYVEDDVVNWQTGAVVLRWRNWELMPPELVVVDNDEEVYHWAGKTYAPGCYDG